MKDIIKTSKFLSRVLRHEPQAIHLTMDTNGWVDIDELITNANKYHNMQLTREIVNEIVKINDKQRFIINTATNRIRANQGHSIDIDLALLPQMPPEELYHGTARQFLESIMRDGIKPMRRQYVHLSRTVEIAASVGKRHGEPVVLHIDTKTMYDNGFKFYLSENKVWLAESVPVEFIRSIKEPK